MNNSRTPSSSLLHRSGIAARLANMSPATLRVWERRYAIVNPDRSAAGQRLYSEDDVARLKRLKQLVDRGYAIGTLARCTTPQLDQLLRNFSFAGQQPFRAFRWSIVGKALSQRVERWGLEGITSIYADIHAALREADPAAADIILVHSPTLRDEVLDPLTQLKGRDKGVQMAVIYAFGTSAALEHLRAAGIHLARDPLNRSQFEQLATELAKARTEVLEPATKEPSSAARMFSEDELLQFERAAASIRCECPAHLVNLILQTAAFEAYSQQCLQKSPEDESLHRHLGEIAGQARHLFETAVAAVARSEGLSLAELSRNE